MTGYFGPARCWRRMQSSRRSALHLQHFKVRHTTSEFWREIDSHSSQPAPTYSILPSFQVRPRHSWNWRDPRQGSSVLISMMNSATLTDLFRSKLKTESSPSYRRTGDG